MQIGTVNQAPWNCKNVGFYFSIPSTQNFFQCQLHTYICKMVQNNFRPNEWETFSRYCLICDKKIRLYCHFLGHYLKNMYPVKICKSKKGKNTNMQHIFKCLLATFSLFSIVKLKSVQPIIFFIVILTPTLCTFLKPNSFSNNYSTWFDWNLISLLMWSGKYWGVIQ